MGLLIVVQKRFVIYFKLCVCFDCWDRYPMQKLLNQTSLYFSFIKNK